MLQLHPEYIIDENSHKKAVIIPYSEWKIILEDMEELEDIRDYDAAKINKDDTISFEQAIQEIESGKVDDL